MGTLAIEAEAALRLSYEEALDSSKSRKVNLSLQLLTLAFKLIKYEKSWTNLLEHKATLEAPIWDLMENAYEELIFFRAFLIDLLRQQTELEKLDDLLMRAEVAVHKAALISSFSYESSMDGINTGKIFDFLQEIESVKVAVREVCFQFLDASLCNTNLTDVESLINFLLNHLERVLDCDAGSISFLKNRIPIIKKQLVYLGSFIADIVQYHDMRQELQDLVKRVQGVNDRTKYVCFFSIRGYRPAWYYMLHLSDVKQLLKFVEAEVKMIIPKVPDWSNSFPKTNGLGFLNCFLEKLDELLCSKLDCIIEMKHQIGSVKEVLFCLSDHFAENYDENDEVYGLVTSVTEMAYKAEFVIDSCLTSSHPLW